MENKRFLTAQDVMEMLEVSLSYVSIMQMISCLMKRLFITTLMQGFYL